MGRDSGAGVSHIKQVAPYAVKNALKCLGVVVAVGTVVQILAGAMVGLRRAPNIEPDDDAKVAPSFRAYAVPAGDVVVDGDLAEWNGMYPFYDLNNALKGSSIQVPIGIQDCKGSYALSVDPRSGILHIAVRVVDESVVLNGVAWNEADRCEIYLSTSGAPDSVIQYVLWAGRDSSRGDGAEFIAASRVVADGVTYEAGIAISDGKTRKLPGTLSVDVALCDKDRDGTFSWISWSPGAPKSERSMLGSVEVLEADEEMMILEGKVSDKRSAAGELIEIARDGAILGRVSVGQDGRFGGWFPAGSCVVRRRSTPGEVEVTHTEDDSSVVVTGEIPTLSLSVRCVRVTVGG